MNTLGPVVCSAIVMKFFNDPGVSAMVGYWTGVWVQYRLDHRPWRK